MRSPSCWRLAVPILVMAVMGCTSLKSGRVERAYAVAPAGVVYYLPLTELEIGLMREIKTCECSYEEAGQRKACEISKPRPEWEFTLEIALTPTVQSRFLANPDEAYVIDYNGLAHWFKATSIKVNLYNNGTLRGINSEITDKTRQVVRDAVKGAIRVAAMTMGVPPLPLEAKEAGQRRPTPPPIHLCTSAVLAALANIKTLQGQIEEKTGAIAATELALEYERGRGQALAAELQKMRDRLAADRETLVKLQARLDRETAKARDTTLSFMRPTAGSLDLQLAPGPTRVERWFNARAIAFWGAQAPDMFIGVPNEGGAKDAPERVVPVATVAWAQVNVSKEHDARSNSNVLRRPSRNPKTMPVAEGLVYRQPATAELLVCKERQCLERAGGRVSETYRLHSMTVLLPQLGVIARLPLSNAVFQSNTFVVEFTESGAVTKLHYTDESRAETAAATFAESAEAASKLIKAREDAEIGHIEADTKRLKAETERLRAAKERADAERALQNTPSP